MICCHTVEYDNNNTSNLILFPAQCSRKLESGVRAVALWTETDGVIECG